MFTTRLGSSMMRQTIRHCRTSTHVLSTPRISNGCRALGEKPNVPALYGTTDDWSTWKRSMLEKNAADTRAEIDRLCKELQPCLPKELYPTLAKVDNYYLLNDISYMYVMYGDRRPTILPYQRVSVRRTILKHIGTLEGDASKKDTITLLLWVMRDFGCL